VTETRFRQAFLLILVAAISVAFVAMIRAFLVTILLSAIFAGLSYPAYQWILGRLRGHKAIAAIATLVLLLALVLAPLLVVLGAGANEALRVSETIRPGLQRLIDQPGELDSRLRAVPGYERIEPYRALILTKAGELVGGTSAFLFAVLSATTRATGLFVFHFFVLLYTMFFFLTGGPALLGAVLAYLPLTDADKQRMVGKFVSVTRATLKGTVLIGAVQGVLGGLAFWAAGLDGAIFWGTAMTVLSIVPGIGGALIWVPASIVLVATGEVGRGIGLALFCALIVGTVDNALRPRLVGKDTKMHELLIFFSTLGGLMVFGAMGFILGPILAALFVTAWEMFGTAFRSELVEPNAPQTGDVSAGNRAG
jgi:predicted PurR-regulated permease PerM